MLKVFENDVIGEKVINLDALAREGARQMLVAALKEDVVPYIERQ